MELNGVTVENRHMTVKLNAYYDDETRIIHVLDLHGPTSVTNGFDFVCLYLLRAMRLEGDSYRFFGYHTDGIVSEFVPSTESFKTVDSSLIYEPYRRLMLEMKFY